MKRLVCGRQVDLPDIAVEDEVDATAVRQAAGQTNGRALTVAHANGQVDLLPAYGRVRLMPNDQVFSELNAARGRLQYHDLALAHLNRLALVYNVQASSDLQRVNVYDFPLPPGWTPSSCEVRLCLPSGYPITPPGLSPEHGIYLPATLRYRHQCVKDFHDHATRDGCKWWCYRHFSDWNPKSDDILTILDRLSFDLSHPVVQ